MLQSITMQYQQFLIHSFPGDCWSKIWSTPKSQQDGLQVIPLLLQRLQFLLIPPRVKTTNAVNSKKSDLPTSSRSIRMQDAQLQVIPRLHLQSSVICLLTPINLLGASKKSKPPWIICLQPNSTFVQHIFLLIQPLQGVNSWSRSEFELREWGSDSQAGGRVWFNRQFPNKAPPPPPAMNPTIRLAWICWWCNQQPNKDGDEEELHLHKYVNTCSLLMRM